MTEQNKKELERIKSDYSAVMLEGEYEDLFGEIATLINDVADWVEAKKKEWQREIAREYIRAILSTKIGVLDKTIKAEMLNKVGFSIDGFDIKDIEENLDKLGIKD
jgi:hypothetical protein